MAWDLMQLLPNMMKAYTNIIPETIFFSIIIAALVIGMWRRNRSVRLVLVVFVMLGGLLFTKGAGLYMGITGEMQAIGLVLASLAFAGIAVTFIKK